MHSEDGLTRLPGAQQTGRSLCTFESGWPASQRRVAQPATMSSTWAVVSERWLYTSHDLYPEWAETWLHCKTDRQKTVIIE